MDPDDLRYLQCRTFEALVRHFQGTKSLQQLAVFLLSSVQLDDASAVSEAVVSQTLQETLRSRPQLPAKGDVEDVIQNAEHQEFLDQAGLGRWASSQTRGPSLATLVLLEVLWRLGKTSGCALSDVLGQVLFKFRGAEPVRNSEIYQTVAADISWLGSRGGDDGAHMDIVDTFFDRLTASDRHRLTWKLWSKVVALMTANPLISSKCVPRREFDRLFYQEVRRQRAPDEGFQWVNSLDRLGFSRLLLQLADATKIHPKVLFLIIGSHADACSDE